MFWRVDVIITIMTSVLDDEIRIGVNGVAAARGNRIPRAGSYGFLVVVLGLGREVIIGAGIFGVEVIDVVGIVRRHIEVYCI
jgi:hypothetical protein